MICRNDEFLSMIMRFFSIGISDERSGNTSSIGLDSRQMRTVVSAEMKRVAFGWFPESRHHIHKFHEERIVANKVPDLSRNSGETMFEWCVAREGWSSKWLSRLGLAPSFIIKRSPPIPLRVTTSVEYPRNQLLDNWQNERFQSCSREYAMGRSFHW